MKWLKQFIHRHSTSLNISMLVINFIILLVSTYNAIQISGEMRVLSDELALQRISFNLEIAPDWQVLWEYMKENLHEGMPRDKVLKELDKVGPYIIKSQGKGICEIVEFQLGLAKRTRYAMRFCYHDDEVKSLRDYHIISE